MLNDGNINWKLPNIKPNDTNESKSIDTTNKNSHIIKLPIPLDQITIKNGQFNYLKDNNLTKLEKLNLNLQFNSTTGSIKFTGSFNSLEQHYSLSGIIKQLKNNINLITEINALEQKINLIGDLNLDQLIFNGNITLQGNLEKLLNISNLPVNTPKNYKIEAKINVTKSEANLNSIILTLGKTKGNGKFNYNIKNNQGNLFLKINPGTVIINYAIKKSSFNSLENSINIKANNISLFLDTLGFNFPKLFKIIS